MTIVFATSMRAFLSTGFLALRGTLVVCRACQLALMLAIESPLAGMWDMLLTVYTRVWVISCGIQFLTLGTSGIAASATARHYTSAKSVAGVQRRIC